MMSQKGKSLYVGALALLIFTMLRCYINVSNMCFYLMMCVAFVIVTLGTYICWRNNDRKESPVVQKAWALLPVITLLVWIILFFKNETKAESPLDIDALIRNRMPLMIWIMLTIAGTFVCILILNKQNNNRFFKYKYFVRMIISLIFTIGTAIQFYAPNIFLDVQGGTYHSHAYTNSIINVCWFVPYSDTMEALYGHYAIMFMPVLKALHAFLKIDYLTGIFVVCAVVAGISILLYLWVISYFTKNDLIFYLAMLAIGEKYFMLMQGGVSLQLHPHRMIFPIMITALAVLEIKKNKKYSIIVALVIALSIVWSTEVGLVIMIAFSVYRWIERVSDGQKLSLTKCCLLLLEILKFSVIPFVLAYIIVNGYNVLVNGNVLNLEQFLFPLISEKGYVSSIELPLPDVTHAWTGTIILFLCAVCVGIMTVLFPDEKKCLTKTNFCFFIGVMSLGLLLYYINRPVEGCLFIVLFLMLIFQVIILEKSQEEYKEWNKDSISILNKKNRFFLLSLRMITTFILFFMAFDCVYSMPEAWNTSKEGIWKRAELQEFMQQIYVQVPPDAVSFGEGVPEMLSMIDRDTHLHTTEWSYLNMPLDTMEDIRYRLEGEKWLFCNLYSLSLMNEEFPGLTEDYYLNDIFEYEDVHFGFFIKND